MALSTRSKLIIALAVVVCVIGILVRTAITHASTYYVTVNEFFQETSVQQTRETTISGEIIGKTIHWDPTTSILQFSMQDTTGGKTLAVTYKGGKPDDFTDNWPVIVTGQLQSNGVFKAQKLLIKCPSKYDAQNGTANASAAS